MGELPLNDMAKNLVLWMIIAGVLLTVFNNINRDPQADSIIYSQFVKELRDGRVQAVDIQNLQITGYRSDGSRFRSIMPAIGDRGLMDELLESNVAISGTQDEKPGFLSQLFLSLLPVLVIVGLTRGRYLHLVRRRVGNQQCRHATFW